MSTTTNRMYQRCTVCKRRVIAASSQCKCKKYVCPKHKGVDLHSCSFDYRKMAQQKLRKQNPLVVKNKVIRI